MQKIRNISSFNSQQNLKNLILGPLGAFLSNKPQNKNLVISSLYDIVTSCKKIKKSIILTQF